MIYYTISLYNFSIAPHFHAYAFSCLNKQEELICSAAFHFLYRLFVIAKTQESAHRRACGFFEKGCECTGPMHSVIWYRIFVILCIYNTACDPCLSSITFYSLFFSTSAGVIFFSFAVSIPFTAKYMSMIPT